MMVGIALIPIAFAFKMIMWALQSKSSSKSVNPLTGESSESSSSGGVEIKQILFACAAIPLMAASIVVASMIFQAFQKVEDPWGLIISPSSMAVAIAEYAIIIKLIKEMKLNLSDIVKGSLAVIVISAAIMVSSLILGLGTYDKYPNLEWSAGVGLSLLAFGAGAVSIRTSHRYWNRYRSFNIRFSRNISSSRNNCCSIFYII